MPLNLKLYFNYVKLNTMEFYNTDSPATAYFVEDSFVLRGTRSFDPAAYSWTSNRACLYMSFNFIGGIVSLNVYDDEAGAYSHQYDSQSVEGLEEFLASVEADYNVTLPKPFLELPAKFFSLAKESFYIEVNLDEDPKNAYVYCDQCGDTNGNSFIGFYFPAINENTPATLATGWDYGCFGGEKISGELELVKKEATELLNRAMNAADISASNEIKAFITKLEKV